MSGRKKSVKRINLALQGGGAHGAFTWGVIDALLEDGRLAFEAISGTSAGAMNAVVLADALHQGGPDLAREKLEDFWFAISREGALGLSPIQADILDRMFSFWPMPFSGSGFLSQFSSLSSPYEFNPLNINPLRDVLERLVDFERVRACRQVKLFIAATRVRDGKITLFRHENLTADAVLASACLPYLFQAIEFDGEAYWDGGYSGNPALFPFFTETKSEDILLVQINPIERQEVPRTLQEIVERVSEITFNASLLRELRAIDFVNRMIDEGRLDEASYRRNRLHRVDATEALAGYSASTKLDTSRRFFEDLKQRGRSAAQAFLAEHYDSIGTRATLDLRAAFS